MVHSSYIQYQNHNCMRRLKASPKWPGWNTGLHMFAHKINLSKMKLVWFHGFSPSPIGPITTAGWRLATAWAPEPYAQRYASERSRNRWSATKASRRGTWRVMIWAIAWIHEMLIGYKSPIHGDLRMDKLDLDSQLILYIMELGGCEKNFSTLQKISQHCNRAMGNMTIDQWIGLVPCSMIRLHRLFLLRPPPWTNLGRHSAKDIYDSYDSCD